MNAQELAAFRQQKDQEFKSSYQSPLTPEQQAAFDGLNYYEHNPALDLVVTLEPFEFQDEIELQTTSGDVKDFTRLGRFVFDVDGETVQLTLYEASYGFFLTFVDANAGTETYPAGRYLEPEFLGGDRFHVDFNLAYNPFCAYGDGWSCPITPVENRLKVAILAGEKLPDKAWAPQE